MGLLDKTNPSATRESVILHAKIFGVLAAVCYGISMIWWPALREGWWIWLPLVSAIGAALGALMEWQLNDALDINLVVDDVEDEFGIKIPEIERKTIQTPSDLLQCVLKAIGADALGTTPGNVPDEASIWHRLQTVLVKGVGIDRDEVTPTAKFFPDLSVMTYPPANANWTDTLTPEVAKKEL